MQKRHHLRKYLIVSSLLFIQNVPKNVPQLRQRNLFTKNNDIIGLPHEPEGGNEIASRGWMCNGFNPEGEARGMMTHCQFTQGMQFHCLPRAHVAILLSHGLLYNSLKNILFSNKEQQQIAEKFVKSTVLRQSCERIAKNSSNQLNINNFEKKIKKFRQIDGKFEVAMEIP